MHPRAFQFLREIAGREPIAVDVRGGCMEPLIRAGSGVHVRRRRLYLPGDVVVFRTNAGDLAAHRVLGYRRRGGRTLLVTKGDRCILHDPPVDREQIVGAIEGLAIRRRARIRALAQFAGLIARRLMR